MRGIIGHETSGRTREAFRVRGLDVVSADFLPAKDGSDNHIQGDIFEIVEANGPFDFGIFHPTCTYLTNSAAWAFGDGPYHQKVKAGTLVGAARREAREKALLDVRRIMAFTATGIVKRTVIENPVGAISSAIRKPDQIIHPFQFGDDASKATCLWLDGFRPLLLGRYVKPRLICADCGALHCYDVAFRHGCPNCGAEAGKMRPRWSNQTDSGQNRLTPSPDRWSLRSETYLGIAEAFAEQWTTQLAA